MDDYGSVLSGESSIIKAAQINVYDGHKKWKRRKTQSLVHPQQPDMHKCNLLYFKMI